MKATIYISGEIGTDATLLDVIRQYKSFDNVTELEVHVDSYGGSVSEGDAIYNYLRGLASEVAVTTITKCAYSIAAKIFCAGDTRIVHDVADAVMIHFAWVSGVGGTASEVEEVAATLRNLEKDFKKFYSEVLDIDEAAASALLDNETYMSGQEAKDIGLATELRVAPKALALFDSNNNQNNNSMKREKRKSIVAKAMDFFKQIFAELVVQDATGQEIVFPDLDAGDMPAIGDAATVDGAPITDGSYVMPSLDNATYVFVGGLVTEIIDAEPDGSASTEPVAKVDPKAATVQEVSVWSVDVVNNEFAVGDVVMRLDHWDNTTRPLSAGEYVVPDGRTIVTDAKGVIVYMSVVGSQPDADAIAAARELVGNGIDIAAIRATYANELSKKDTEIKALKAQIGSLEVTVSAKTTQPPSKKANEPKTANWLVGKKN